jgi:hypothetical protein
MGQFHYICNIDKMEYLKPSAFGDGLKLLDHRYVLDGLGVLLAASNGKGSGDYSSSKFAGRWAGDRIATIGDYFDEEDPLYATIQSTPFNDESSWTDISSPVANYCKEYV